MSGFELTPAQAAALEADLDRLAAEDPEVAEAADRLAWMAQKVAMGWPAK